MAADDTAPIAVNAVIRRAIELDDGLPGRGLEQPLDTATLADIGSEVGISAAAMAAAVAEARAGALDRRSLLDRLVGPRLVSAHRPIDTDGEAARERLLDWLAVTHGLSGRIQADGVVVAHRRRDLVGVVGIGLRRVQGFGGLAVANEIRAATVGADLTDPRGPESGAVCIVADVGSKRKDAILGGSMVAVGASLAVGIAAAMTAPVTLVGLPVAAGLGTLVARKTYRTTVVRMGHSIDGVVDGVAREQDPPRPRGSLARRRRSGRRTPPE